MVFGLWIILNHDFSDLANDERKFDPELRLVASELKSPANGSDIRGKNTIQTILFTLILFY